jgi:molecular chaperone GrpE
MSRKGEIDKVTSEHTDSDSKEKKDKTDEVKKLKSRIKKKDSELKHLKKDLDDLKTEYLRQLADKENLRKRLEREKTEFYQHALGEALREFLAVLDNFERALQSDIEDEDKSFRDGIEMIYKQFQSVLEKQGVRPVVIEDKKFDPRFHQAFATQESNDVKEPQVGEEYQKGYLLHERLLRPSLVKVLVPKKEKE